MKSKAIIIILALVLLCILLAFIANYAIFFILMAGVGIGAYLYRKGNKMYYGALIVLGFAIIVGALAGLSTFVVGKVISLVSDRLPYTLDVTNWLISGPLDSPVDKIGRLGLLFGMIFGIIFTAIKKPEKRMHGIGVVQGYQVVEGGWSDPESISELVEFGPPIIDRKLEPEKNSPKLKIKDKLLPAKTDELQFIVSGPITATEVKSVKSLSGKTYKKKDALKSLLIEAKQEKSKNSYDVSQDISVIFPLGGKFNEIEFILEQVAITDANSFAFGTAVKFILDGTTVDEEQITKENLLVSEKKVKFSVTGSKQLTVKLNTFCNEGEVNTTEPFFPLIIANLNFREGKNE